MHRVSSSVTHGQEYDGHQGGVCQQVSVASRLRHSACSRQRCCAQNNDEESLRVPRFSIHGLLNCRQIVGAHLRHAYSHQTPPISIVDHRSSIYSVQSLPQARYSSLAAPVVCYAADTGQPDAELPSGHTPEDRALPSAPPMCDEDSIYPSPYEPLPEGWTQQRTSYAYAQSVITSSPYEQPAYRRTQYTTHLANTGGMSHLSPYERQMDHRINQIVPLEYVERMNVSLPCGQEFNCYHQPTPHFESYRVSHSSLSCGPQGHSQDLHIPRNGPTETAPPVKITQPTATTEKVISYLGWSLFSFLCCCWPLGLAALIYSTKASNARTPDDARRKYSLRARNLNIAACVVFPLILIILVPSIITLPSASQRTSAYVKTQASYSRALSYSYYTANSYYDYYYKVTQYRMEQNVGYRYETIYA